MFRSMFYVAEFWSSGGKEGMRPVKTKLEDTKLFILKSVESQHALLQSLAAPLIAKAEETGTQFPSCWER